MKTINGKNYIEAKVHRLPAVNWGVITELSDKMCPAPLGNRHLYITTDGKPKKGEYGYNTLEKIVSKIEVDDINHTWKKIIATTDPKLTVEVRKELLVGSTTVPRLLPQIPQYFIEEYCKAGGIDEVFVEFENTAKGWQSLANHGAKGSTIIPDDWKPKLNPDNTIIISKITEVCKHCGNPL